jgi:hypothetical protein
MDFKDLERLSYKQPNPAIVKVGTLCEFGEFDEILSHYLHKGTFDNYLRKFVWSTDEYEYFVQMRIGFVVFYYFFKREQSIRHIFLKCKDYLIVRKSKATGIVEFSETNPFDRTIFADDFEITDDILYDEDIYSDYAKQLCKDCVK